jgi:uncharacterized cupin superfamily protein
LRTLAHQGERVTELQPNSVVRAAAAELTLEPVPADQSVRDNPATGATAFGEFDGLEVGIWEMTPGVMTDVEVNELFVVLSGSATVEFADGTPAMRLGPGDIVRLAEESETTWTVTETLRKVYLT